MIHAENKTNLEVKTKPFTPKQFQKTVSIELDDSPSITWDQQLSDEINVQVDPEPDVMGNPLLENQGVSLASKGTISKIMNFKKPVAKADSPPAVYIQDQVCDKFADVSLSQQIESSPQEPIDRRPIVKQNKQKMKKKITKKTFTRKKIENDEVVTNNSLNSSRIRTTRSGRWRKVLPLPVSPESSILSATEPDQVTTKVIPADISHNVSKGQMHKSASGIGRSMSAANEQGDVEDEKRRCDRASLTADIEVTEVKHSPGGNQSVPGINPSYKDDDLNISPETRQICNTTFTVCGRTHSNKSSISVYEATSGQNNSSSSNNKTPNSPLHESTAVKTYNNELHVSVESSYTESPSVSFISQKRLSRSSLNLSGGSIRQPSPSESDEPETHVSLAAKESLLSENVPAMDNTNEIIDDIMKSSDMNSMVYDMTTLLSEPGQPDRSRSFLTPTGDPSDQVDQGNGQADTRPLTQLVPVTPSSPLLIKMAQPSKTRKVKRADPVMDAEKSMQLNASLAVTGHSNNIASALISNKAHDNDVKPSSTALHHSSAHRNPSEKLCAVSDITPIDNDTVPETQNAPPVATVMSDDETKFETVPETHQSTPETGEDVEAEVSKTPSQVQCDSNHVTNKENVNSQPIEGNTDPSPLSERPKRRRPAIKTRTRTRSEPAKPATTTRAESKRTRSLSEQQPRAPAGDGDEEIISVSTKPRVSFADIVKYAMTPRSRGKAIVAMFDTPEPSSAITPKSILKSTGSTPSKELHATSFDCYNAVAREITPKAMPASDGLVKETRDEVSCNSDDTTVKAHRIAAVTTGKAHNIADDTTTVKAHNIVDDTTVNFCNPCPTQHENSNSSHFMFIHPPVEVSDQNDSI